jgi:hypothetical protein
MPATRTCGSVTCGTNERLQGHGTCYRWSMDGDETDSGPTEWQHYSLWGVPWGQQRQNPAYARDAWPKFCSQLIGPHN